ncbi:MAG: inositol monophosphatase [Gammaproteobacteria bacterium]|nr:inositol monophosphatase [Gammaproteobacteria bacterium]
MFKPPPQPLSRSATEELFQIALQAATAAGRLLAEHHGRPGRIEMKPGGDSLAAQVVTELDRRSQSTILELLTPTLDPYRLGLLSEEQEDDGSRFDNDYFWAVDPLDGTLSFSQSSPGYAVSIALVARSGTPVIAAVYDPPRHTLYAAIRGQGAWRNSERWQPLLPPAASSPLTLICDQTLLAAPDYRQIIHQLETIADRAGFSGVAVHPGGGAVMNSCQALEMHPACYFKRPKKVAGGGSLWDFAATALLFAEMGGVACNFKGEPLELNRQESLFMNREGVLYSTVPQLVSELAAHIPQLV